MADQPRQPEETDLPEVRLPDPDELPALRDALRDLARPPRPAPEAFRALDDEITVAAEAHLDAARRVRHMRLFRRTFRIAALIIVAVGAGLLATKYLLPDRSQPVAVTLPADFDPRGEVDILDAFALARALEQDQVIPPAWDVTNDRKIDDDDVQRLAQLAVRLNGGPG